MATKAAVKDGIGLESYKNHVCEPVAQTVPQTVVSPTKPDTARIRLTQYERRAGRRATIDSADYPWSPTGTIFEEDSYDTKSVKEYGSQSSTASSTLIGTSDGSQRHVNIAQPAGITCPPQGPEDVFSTLCQSTPTLSRRYEREIAIKGHNQSWIIEPTSMPYLRRDEVPGWIRRTNPDGQPYFFRAIKSDRYTRRYATEANLTDCDIYYEVGNILNGIESEIEKHKTLPGVFDVVLEQLEDEWAYYMVDHSRRSIFWLRSFDATWIAEQVFGLSSFEQMEHWFHYEYWTFMEQFPHIEEISDGAIDELTGILIHGSIDTMTSLDSTMIYSLDECRDMLGIVRQIRNLRASERKTQICDPFMAVSISRMMAMFEQSRFMNLYGHHGARLGREQSIRGPVKNYRTFLIIFLSPLLFRSPDTHLRGLKNIWVDKVINQRPWKIFVDTLKEEWIEFILYATVLLNANVAFLAIPNVEDNSTQLTLSQVASLLSIIASMGSILVGLLLVRQHRTRSKETAAEAAAYLLKRTHHTLGLETLAIMYSLPYALLMWGMVMFLVAVAVLCFGGTALWQQILFALAWAAIAVLVFWTVYTGWETTEPSTVEGFLNWLRHCVSLMKTRKRDPEADNEVFERRSKAFVLRKVLHRRFKRWHQSNASLTSVENSYNDDQ